VGLGGANLAFVILIFRMLRYLRYLGVQNLSFSSAIVSVSSASSVVSFFFAVSALYVADPLRMGVSVVISCPQEFFMFS